MKILHGIEFYSFTICDRTVKFKSINYWPINGTILLLKYFSYKAKNKGTSSSSPLSLPVSLLTRIPSLSSGKLLRRVHTMKVMRIGSELILHFLHSH